MDSMVNHYTVAKKHRKTDAFTPGGVMGKRPDRAVTVYGNLIRRTYKHTPMILGGIEASLRRLSHYDYWSDQVRRSVLLDSGADLISYGMGELSIVAIADALAAGIDVHDVTFIPGTVYRSKTLDHLIDPVCCRHSRRCGRASGRMRRALRFSIKIRCHQCEADGRAV